MLLLSLFPPELQFFNSFLNYPPPDRFNPFIGILFSKKMWLCLFAVLFISILHLPIFLFLLIYFSVDRSPFRMECLFTTHTFPNSENDVFHIPYKALSSSDLLSIWRLKSIASLLWCIFADVLTLCRVEMSFTVNRTLFRCRYTDTGVGEDKSFFFSTHIALCSYTGKPLHICT